MANPNTPLHPSQEKIRRAKGKFDYLKTVINNYITADPYTVRIDIDGQTKRLVASRVVEPPQDIGFEVVEAVGHLRSALDKMIVAVVTLNGRGVSGVGFPFGGMDNGQIDPFPSTRMLNGIKKKLTDEQWLLIEAYRPYPGGNDTLWSINQIANADKHGAGLVSVIPKYLGGTGIGAAGTNWSGGIITFGPVQDDTLPYDYERETVLLSVMGGVGKLGIQHHPAPLIVFDKIAPVAGRNVLTTLNEQIRITEHIVKAFTNAFF